MYLENFAFKTLLFRLHIHVSLLWIYDTKSVSSPTRKTCAIQEKWLNKQLQWVTDYILCSHNYWRWS